MFVLGNEGEMKNINLINFRLPDLSSIYLSF